MFVCISLIEHTRKMDANRQNKLVVIDEGQPLKQETVKQKVEAQPEQQTTKVSYNCQYHNTSIITCYTTLRNLEKTL